jgi:S-methylmethionine-dependent homocysteine/selenocysteine methylase
MICGREGCPACVCIQRVESWCNNSGGSLSVKVVPEVSLSQGVMLLDGGMGQELQCRGVQGANTLWSAHALISAPNIVQAVQS